MRSYTEELSETAGIHVFLFSSRGDSLITVRVPKRIGVLIKRLARRAFVTEQMVFSEATIALPLLVSHAYHGGKWRGRAPRKYVELLRG